MNPVNRKLTREKLQRAVELLDAGLGRQEIGRQLGVTGTGLHEALQRAGLPTDRWPAWTISDCHGYMQVRKPGVARPFLAHRLAMEHALGRRLRRGEVVHHINENKRDNRIANLELLPSISVHRRHHGPGPASGDRCACGAKAWMLRRNTAPMCRPCFNHERRYHLDGPCSMKRGVCPLSR